MSITSTSLPPWTAHGPRASSRSPRRPEGGSTTGQAMSARWRPPGARTRPAGRTRTRSGRSAPRIPGVQSTTSSEPPRRGTDRRPTRGLLSDHLLSARGGGLPAGRPLASRPTPHAPRPRRAGGETRSPADRRRSAGLVRGRRGAVVREREAASRTGYRLVSPPRGRRDAGTWSRSTAWRLVASPRRSYRGVVVPRRDRTAA